jgi:methionyl aminopeptidase
MSIKSQIEFDKLRAIGRIVRRALDTMARSAQPGVTTAELDRIGAAVLADAGAESAPPKVYGFPNAVCISVNEEAIHGIPGDRTLQAGDLLKLDLVAEKDGFFADAALTVPVGSVSPDAAALVRCAERAFEQGLKAARAGNRVYEIGRAVEREVKASGFSVIRELCGHGGGERSTKRRPFRTFAICARA